MNKDEVIKSWEMIRQVIDVSIQKGLIANLDSSMQLYQAVKTIEKIITNDITKDQIKLEN